MRAASGSVNPPSELIVQDPVAFAKHKFGFGALIGKIVDFTCFRCEVHVSINVNAP